MLKIAMLGAGSGFVLSVAKELVNQEIFADGEFVIMDPAADRLAAAEASVNELFKNARTAPKLTAVTGYEPALTGANYVITSCEKNRYANWVPSGGKTHRPAIQPELNHLLTRLEDYVQDFYGKKYEFKMLDTFQDLTLYVG